MALTATLDGGITALDIPASAGDVDVPGGTATGLAFANAAVLVAAPGRALAGTMCAGGGVAGGFGTLTGIFLANPTAGGSAEGVAGGWLSDEA